MECHRRKLASASTSVIIEDHGTAQRISFVGKLTTIGRRTTLPRTVELRLVYLNGRFYASSSRIENKHWCQNLLKNPAVEINVGDERFPCLAQPVSDENLRRRILALRDSPALLDRVVFEMSPKPSFKQP